VPITRVWKYPIQSNTIFSLQLDHKIINLSISYNYNMITKNTKKIAMPGVKTFFSIPIQETEQSIFNSVAVLDETADKKDTVLKVLNILHEQFQVGVNGFEI
jgi:hypothetical protein